MTDTTAQIFAVLVALAIVSAIVDEEFFFNTLRSIRRNRAARSEISVSARTHFQLLRYFTAVGLTMMALVTLTLFYFDREQARAVSGGQGQHAQVLAVALDHFDKEYRASGQRDLVHQQEVGHLKAARLITNVLGEGAVASLLAQSQQVSSQACQAMTGEGLAAIQARRNCFAGLAPALGALPGQSALTKRLAELVRQSGLADVRVLDLRGLTVIAGDPSRVGEERTITPTGLQPGKASSELVSTEPLAVIAGKSEKRDFIVTRLPLLAGDAARIAGVLELSSEVSADLAAMTKNSQIIRGVLAANQLKGFSTSAEVEAQMRSSSNWVLVVVGVLMATLFGVLFMLVRRADELGRKREQDLAQTQAKLEEITLVANSNHLDPAMASEIKVGLARIRQHLHTVQLGLVEAKAPLRVAEVLSAAILGAEGDKLLLNIAKAKAQLERVPEGGLSLADLHQRIDVARSQLDQISDMIEDARAPVSQSLAGQM